MTLRVVATVILAYLLGAIPTSYLVARARGVDLRAVGSGNLGATNLHRALGWKFAVPVGVFDVLKGAIPVLVLAPWVHASLTGALAIGVAAVAGHVFSVFMHFHGGKGVATSAGVLLALAPAAFGVAIAVWGIVLFLSGYMSLASITAAIALPGAVWLVEPSRRSTAIWFAILALGVIWMHRANIRRLRTGTEHRFGRRRPPAGTTPR